VKFLIDNNLSPLLAESLTAHGHDALHLRDLGMQAATDEAVLARAAAKAGYWSQLTPTLADSSPGPGRPAHQSCSSAAWPDAVPPSSQSSSGPTLTRWPKI
jgi:Domain of unknown function (DUF5615)